MNRKTLENVVMDMDDTVAQDAAVTRRPLLLHGPRLRRRSAAACAAALLALLSPGCRFGDRTRPAPPEPVVTMDPTPEQREELREAQQAAEAGDYEVALAMFQDLLAENPTLTTAYVGVGDIHIEQKDYDAAERAFRRASRLEPRSFEAQHGHGLALQMLRRFVEAVAAYHRALSIQPDSFPTNLNLATTYMEMGQPDRARTFAEQAVELNREDAAARINLGAAYDQLGLHAQAVEQYLVALELTEPTEPLLLNLINALSEERRFREVVNTAQTLLRLAPSANAAERLGWAHFKLGEYEASMQAYHRAVELDPQHWIAWRGIGVNALNAWLLSDRDNTDARAEARDAFRQSLRINPDQPKVIEVMGNYRLF